MRETQNPKYSVPSFIISHCVGSKGIHPRHPPREFPLGLRAPVLGMGTAQIPGNEPFPFLVGGRSFLSPAPRPPSRGSPPPAAQPPLSFFSSRLVCSFRFRFRIAYHSGARLFLLTGLAEMPEGGKCMRLVPSLPCAC